MFDLLLYRMEYSTLPKLLSTTAFIGATVTQNSAKITKVRTDGGDEYLFYITGELLPKTIENMRGLMNEHHPNFKMFPSYSK